MEDDHNRGTADGGYRATGIGEGSMADLPTITPAMPISRGAARLAQVTAATFVVLLTVLHCVKPELDPSWRFISEYAIGRHGWMMVLAFFALSVSYVACSRRSVHRCGPSADASGWTSCS